MFFIFRLEEALHPRRVGCCGAGCGKKELPVCVSKCRRNPII